jgi:hypothetical protein
MILFGGNFRFNMSQNADPSSNVSLTNGASLSEMRRDIWTISSKIDRLEQQLKLLNQQLHLKP